MSKILLIADDTQHKKFLEKGLKVYGHEIVASSSYQSNDCWELAANELPDIVMLEMDMLDVNGWQSIQRLKASRETWMIPAIAICDQSIEGKLLIQAGFDSYFRKPVSLKHLLIKTDNLAQANTVPTKSEDKLTANPSLSMADSVSKETFYPKQQVAQTAIVYVEDNSKDSQAMAQIVKGVGYSYANISDSLQALPQLLEYKPQLIFLDLVMPVVNGYELCAQIRRISAFSKTPIVIVTNNDGIVDRVRAKVVGASGFVNKPIEEQRILRVFNKYLNPIQPVQDNARNLRSQIFQTLKWFK